MVAYWLNIVMFGTKFKKIKGIKFRSNPVYDEEYIKAKVKKYDGLIKTNFLGNTLHLYRLYKC